MEGDDFDIRNVLDWDYYLERLNNTIRKIITIPAALQKVPNPVPRVPHPDWLQSTVRKMNDRFKQKDIKSMFGVVKKSLPASTSTNKSSDVMDIEDFSGAARVGPGRPIVHSTRRQRSSPSLNSDDNNDDPVTESEANQKVADVRVKLSKDNLPEWLKKKKELWRNKRKENRKRATFSRQQFASTEPTPKKQKQALGSMEGYVRSAAEALTKHEWHVIESRELASSDGGSSDTFQLWVMIGNKSLQRIRIKMSRTVYVDSRVELQQGHVGPLLVKRADRHLPHNKTSGILYEVSMPEVVCGGDWVEHLKPKDGTIELKSDSLSVYEMGTPLLLRTLMHLGSVCRPNNGRDTKAGVYDLSELSPVSRPADGEYLHPKLSYRRIFFYENLNHKKKSGLVGLFVMDPVGDASSDLTRPQTFDSKSFQMSATCHFWVVKPGGKKVQKNITIKQCENMFGQLLSQLQELASQEEQEDGSGSSEYSCLSPDTKCKVTGLNYAKDEREALAGADEILKAYLQSNNGPTFLLVNSTKPQTQLRKLVPSCNAFPFVPLSFPPGPAHNPNSSVLPSLNWEPTAVQLCLEAYLHMGVVSYPKRVASSRFSQVPIGNLGKDENTSMFDVLYARSLAKSRAVLWASDMPSSPDLGLNASSLVGKSGSGGFRPVESGFNDNDIWSDDDALVSPVVMKPGAYRCICVELDINDLCIAALTDSSLAVTSAAISANQNSSIFDAESQATSQMLSSAAPLGDEMSTAISLPVLRALIQSWLREAYQSNNLTADDLLHDVYRLISSPDLLLNDPALHRVVHSLMKTTFLRLLGELQRLGSTIISADFRKVVISTNKNNIFDAREYVEFVISTILKRAGGDSGANHTAEGLARISLHPNNFYSHYLFLDQNNFGGMHFEQREIEDEDENEITQLFNSVGDHTENQSIVPTVVCGWNIMHYLSDNLAQDYFRTIIGRFSKDVFRKQLQIEHKAKSKVTSISPMSVAIKDDEDENGFLSPQEQLLNYKKKMISKHFAHYLTRVVSELLEDDGGADKFPKLPGSYLSMTDPALEFVKNVLAVLNLDPDVKQEVIYLKKSLFAQIGVHEYSSVTEWKNPAASFMLPDVYCSECRECRDVDLCAIPLEEEESEQVS